MTKQPTQLNQIRSESKPENFQIEKPRSEYGNTSVKDQKLKICVIVVASLMTILLPILFFCFATISGGVEQTSDGDKAPCLEGYTFFNQTGFCYKLYQENLNFEDAETSCKLHGGHLASIHSETEHLFLVGFFNAKSPNAESNEGFGTAWIGMHYRNDDWVWTDDIFDNYVGWAIDEPRSFLSRKYTYLRQNKFGWETSDSKAQRYYICKNPSSQEQLKRPKRRESPCKLFNERSIAEHWFPQTGFCYSIFLDYLYYSLDDCDSSCQKYGKGNAISIHSELEQFYLYGLLVKEKRDHNAWIGLITENEQMIWSDGTQLDYQNWVVEDLEGAETDFQMFTYSNGKWKHYQYGAACFCKKKR